MGSRIRFLILTSFVVFCVSLLQVNAFKVIDHDLEVAASDKHEWEKGDESDFFGEDHEEKGHKAEKGYEDKNGFVFYSFSQFSNENLTKNSFQRRKRRKRTSR